MKELQVGTMPQAKKGPIIVGQHYGLSDLSGLQNTQGLHREVQQFPAGKPPLLEGALSEQRYSIIIIRLPGIRIRIQLLRTGKPLYHNQEISCGLPNMVQHTIVILNLINQERREARPSIRNKGRNANVAPFNLGNAFVDDNEVDDEVLITGVRDNDDYTVYENVDPSKVYMPINAGGDYWVTGVINLPTSRFYMFDSLHSEV
ncbi:phospholipase-like protein [Tanacetum coccineum]